MKLSELFIVLYALCAAIIMGLGAPEEMWIEIGPTLGIVAIVVTCVSILPKWIRKLRDVELLTDLLCFMLPLVGFLAFFMWRGIIDEHSATYIMYAAVIGYVVVKILFKRWFAKKHGVPVNQTNPGTDNEKL